MTAPRGGTSEGDVFQVVAFQVGGHEFAFNVFHVQRVLRYERPVAVPKAPPFLEGLLEARGVVVPVIDLRKRFELSEAAVRDETRIMLVEGDGTNVGVVVDAVSGLVRVPVDAVTAPPPTLWGLAAEYIQGVISLHGRTVVLLRTARLLNSTERIALEQIGVEASHG